MPPRKAIRYSVNVAIIFTRGHTRFCLIMLDYLPYLNAQLLFLALVRPLRHVMRTIGKVRQRNRGSEQVQSTSGNNCDILSNSTGLSIPFVVYFIIQAWRLLLSHMYRLQIVVNVHKFHTCQILSNQHDSQNNLADATQVRETAQPRLTATSLILHVTSLLRPLFQARHNGHTFSYKNTPLLMRSPANTATF